MNSITLGTNIITSEPNARPYIIAEIGVNHEGSMAKARELIELAKMGGADAAKFQTYKAETLASRHSPAYWDTSKEPTRSQYELFKKYDSFNREDYIALAEHCRDTGIDFLSTPFDNEAIEFLDPLMSFYKIASADLTNTPFLRKVAAKQKPVVLSVGASSLEEIHVAVDELVNHGCEHLALLHCVLNYPTAYENANLNMIPALQGEFPRLIIGYSDHTLPDEGMLTVLAAFLKGARIIEKHFTHDKTLPGNDHYHAMDVNDLMVLRKGLERIALVGGACEKTFIESERLSRANARRSIVLKQNVSKGTILTEDLLICKRPAHGISPVHWDEVLGKRCGEDLAEDHVLQWSDIEHYE